jgi:hypothetical protein
MEGSDPLAHVAANLTFDLHPFPARRTGSIAPPQHMVEAIIRLVELRHDNFVAAFTDLVAVIEAMPPHMPSEVGQDPS